jgi:CheY-like chemotaxis protein
LVLDGAMPHLTGYEVCQAVRALPRGARIPVCIVTSSDEGRSIERAFEAGASDFFLKPVHLGVLARKLKFLIDAGQRPGTEAGGGGDTVVDAEGAIRRVNRAFLKHFRTEPREGDSWHAFFTPGGGMRDDSAEGSFLAYLEGRRYDLTLTALPPGHDDARLLLAIEQPEAPPADQPAAESQSEELNEPKPARILILEDQELVQRSIVRLLSREDHRLIVVERADDAIAAFGQAMRESDPFGVVLLDLSIPGSPGGAEVLRAIRGLDGSVRAIATSGAWEDPIMEHPEVYGFDATLPKPFNREELLAKIQEVLAGR